MIEVLVAMGLFSVIMLGTTQYMVSQQGTARTNRSYSDRDVLLNQLYRATQDSSSLLASAAATPAFQSCVTGGTGQTARRWRLSR